MDVETFKNYMFNKKISSGDEKDAVVIFMETLASDKTDNVEKIREAAKQFLKDMEL